MSGPECLSEMAMAHIYPSGARWSESLEIHAHRHNKRPRSHEMRPAEGRQEVVERYFVRQVQHGEACRQVRRLGMPQVIRAHSANLVTCGSRGRG